MLTCVSQITASNINQIGRAQSAGPRRRTGSDAGQTPLQRPKLNQRSFVQEQQQQPDVPQHQYMNGLGQAQHHRQQVTGSGQISPATTRPSVPTPSTMEPNISAMVNNTPYDGMCIAACNTITTLATCSCCDCRHLQ